ncbi:MAG: uracil-DNA glycosylase [Thermodesulfobacteriota bacterium]
MACRHFYVTHEPAFPYGCRALGFKSAQYPAVTVFASSGMHCQLFARKSAAPSPRD